jgi:DNA-directed RNA polymerase specialized sigma24 family protein
MNPARTKSAFRPLRGNTVGELERSIVRFERRLRRAARLIAGGDTDYAKDLYQVAITELWELDPARFDPDEDGYLWQAMMKRMLKAYRDDARSNPIRPPVALRFP